MSRNLPRARLRGWLQLAEAAASLQSCLSGPPVCRSGNIGLVIPCCVYFQRAWEVFGHCMLRFLYLRLIKILRRTNDKIEKKGPGPGPEAHTVGSFRATRMKKINL